MESGKIRIGSRYFRHTDNGVEFVRIVSRHDGEVVKIKFEESGIKRRIKFSELEKFYIRLKEDGTLTVSTVGVNSEKNTLFDVVVMLYDNAECKELGVAALPKVICRQNISDIFANMVSKDGTMYMGCSVSRDNVPADIPFQGLMMCDIVEHSDMISVYKTDTIDDILECIRTKRYDQALDGLFFESIKKYTEYEKKLFIEEGCNTGYVRNLRTLLEINNFNIDFDAAFNIIKVNFNLNPVLGNIDPIILYNLSEIFNCQFETYFMTEYSEDIDLGKIKDGRYLLLRDNTGKVFVMTYTSDIVINPLNISYDKLYSEGIGNAALSKKSNISK